MVCYGTDSALGCGSVRQDGKVGRGEIVLYLRVFNVVCEQLDPVLGRGIVNDSLVFVERAVRLAGDNQLVAPVQSAEGVQQDVKAFVFPDQSEEQQVLHPVPETKRALGLLPGQLLSEVSVYRVEKSDIQGLWRELAKILGDFVAKGDVPGAS